MTPLDQLESLRKLDRALIIAESKGVGWDVRTPVTEVRDHLLKDVRERVKPPSRRRRKTNRET